MGNRFNTAAGIAYQFSAEQGKLLIRRKNKKANLGVFCVGREELVQSSLP